MNPRPEPGAHRRGAAAAAAPFMVAALLSGTTCLGDDWTTGAGGHPARDSRSAETGPAAATLLWNAGQSAIIAQQAVIEGDLVVTARIYNLSNTQGGTNLVGQNLATGAQRWSVQLPVDFPSDWRSRPTGIQGGQVYATRSGNDNAAYLYALRPADGTVIWRSQGLITESSTESLAYAPNGDIITTGSVVLQRLIRINRVDGATVWEVPRISPTSGGSDAAVFGSRIYLWEASGAGPKVAVHDLATGARLYASAGIGGGFVQQCQLLVGPDGTVYAPRMQNNALTDFFVAYQDTGAALVERWRVPLGYVPFATFGVGPDGSVYTYQTPSHSVLNILRLDPATGGTLSTSADLPIDFPAQPRMAVDAAGRVAFTNGGFGTGRLYSFNTDLTERWSAPIGNVNVGGPAIGPGGTLVVCGTGTNIRAYRAPCRVDVNGDGQANVQDFLAFLQLYSAADPGADFDGSGTINVADFLAFLGAYAAGCP